MASTPMQQLEWEDCLIAPRNDPQVARAFRERLGVVPHTASYLGGVRWIVRAAIDLNLGNRQLVEVDPGLNELLWLAVSQDNSCRYCFAAHRAFLRIQGFPESRIRRLEQNVFSDLEPADQAALEFARRVSRSNPLLRWSDTERLREAGWSDAGVREIGFVAAAVVFANRVATVPAIPPVSVEEDPDRWYVRLLRPLLARRLRSHLARGRPQPLPPEMRSGPFQAVVSALDPLPVAHILWHMLDGAFAPSVLPQRSKALVFAVVARGLVCPRSEQEAVRLLEEDGFPRDQIEPTLAHLASPALDPLESVLVPFTRETIRYAEPAPLQRRAREVRDRVGREAFAEIIGLVGLANMLCRLSFVTDTP